MGDELRKNIGVEHDDYADDSRKRHGMPEDKAEDGAFVADLVGGRGGDTDGLCVHHFAHDSAGAVCGAHQNGAEVARGGLKGFESKADHEGSGDGDRRAKSSTTFNKSTEAEAASRSCRRRSGVIAATDCFMISNWPV